ncbi:uncharacterized protein EV422DRAFT_116617 [Fimicolochytrium jonesii]|uniref:uncharacterized protein n=1 Tax=Fimicolochytrium jonesii TaxID=1396493 RepID=UPI0022FF3ECB|nr:uncharacterized protein EV422DRAFT_116617 [Fimicolochytrium jonesii]KAI8819099.1 hypothetical protein EV422DRAFT_116617 [Fimicolochytrium jonesii]
MCDQPLPLEAEALNRHIDECLEAQKNAAAGASSSSGLNVPAIDQGGSGEQWEEYTWAGQTRVRASAMLEGGFAASGFTVRKPAEQDTDEEIDIDDDGTDEFGQTQFGEQHLDPFRSTDDIDPGANADAQPGTVGDSRDTYPSTDHPPSSSSDTKLVIDALKSRIRDLERLSSTSPKCLICLDPYTDPLVSIVCWHVHCEQCWFRTLGTKRLCPQCQKITAPADLRRVYL